MTIKPWKTTFRTGFDDTEKVKEWRLMAAGVSHVMSVQPQISSCHGGGTSEEQQLYWAKGTGFGTGSTASGWDVEQALTKQRLEEEHVTCLLQVRLSMPSKRTSF